MECGVEYNKKKLHGKKYFNDLVVDLGRLGETPDSVIEMVKFNRNILDIYKPLEKKIIKRLKEQPLLKERVDRLQTVPAAGDVLSLTWALEVGDPHRFNCVKKAVSYCGLCSAESSSGGKSKRCPISKQRNEHLQWALIEVAKLAPRYDPHLAEVYAKEFKQGNKNSATIAVARKLAAYLLSVDKSGKDFEHKNEVGKFGNKLNAAGN